MFAPVFLWELRYVFRRRWFHNVRRTYTLIVLFFFLWCVLDSLWYFDSPRFVYSIRAWLWVNREFAGYLTVIHLFAVFLLTPALVVSAVAQARHQRVFELLLSCQQRSRDIVLGHWLAALAKLAILLAPGVPLILLLHTIVGTPWWLIATYLTCLWLLALPIAGWSLLAAIWMRRTTSAFIAAYLGSVALWFMLFALFTDAQRALWSHAVYDGAFLRNFVGLISLPTTLFLAMATARVRYRCNLPSLPDASSTSTPSRPTVGEEPIYWKQYHLVDWFMLGPMRWLPHWARVVGFGLAVLALSSIDTRVADLTPYCESFLILVGFPLIALVWSATSISAEKESQTWDPLRVTMLRARRSCHANLAGHRNAPSSLLARRIARGTSSVIQAEGNDRRRFRLLVSRWRRDPSCGRFWFACVDCRALNRGKRDLCDVGSWRSGRHLWVRQLCCGHVRCCCCPRPDFFHPWQRFDSVKGPICCRDFLGVVDRGHSCADAIGVLANRIIISSTPFGVCCAMKGLSESRKKSHAPKTPQHPRRRASAGAASGSARRARHQARHDRRRLHRRLGRAQRRDSATPRAGRAAHRRSTWIPRTCPRPANGWKRSVIRFICIIPTSPAWNRYLAEHGIDAGRRAPRRPGHVEHASR